MSRRNKNESSDANRAFLQEIPEDKKALLELNFTVQILTSWFQEEKFGTWSAAIKDNNGKKSTIQGKYNEKLALELIAAIEAIRHIYSRYKDDKTKSYVCIEVQTSSIYVTNVLKEWIYTWASDNFEKRPNAEYLRTIYPYLLQYKENINFRWVE